MEMIGKQITVSGWVEHLRRAGRKDNLFCFMDIRDGTSSFSLQCVVQGYPEVTRESTVKLTGTLTKEPRARGGYELHVPESGFSIISLADSKDLEAVTRVDASVPTRLDHRHMMIRGPRTSKILKLRATILQAFRMHLDESGYTETTPPTIVQILCEGGSDLFKVKYFDKDAYLTQSSQMYLEPCISALGSVYCIQPSYRAEMSTGPRHLAEYTHLEAEMPFITFEDLLQAVETLVCETAQKVLSKHGTMLQELRKDHGLEEFKIEDLKRPFKRMTYSDAVEYCREHKIYKKEPGTLSDGSEGVFFEYGDDIPSGPERKMIDMIGEPVIMTRFPAEMKSFYMQRVSDGPMDLKDPEKFRETESVDVLLPGVGEIIGGSMRIDDYDELYKAMVDQKMPIGDYYWYLDCRKFGSCPHGGYGLGVERFMMWLCGIPHIREASLFPRFVGRCTP